MTTIITKIKITIIITSKLLLNMFLMASTGEKHFNILWFCLRLTPFCLWYIGNLWYKILQKDMFIILMSAHQCTIVIWLFFSNKTPTFYRMAPSLLFPFQTIICHLSQLVFSWLCMNRGVSDTVQKICVTGVTQNLKSRFTGSLECESKLLSSRSLWWGFLTWSFYWLPCLSECQVDEPINGTQVSF